MRIRPFLQIQSHILTFCICIDRTDSQGTFDLPVYYSLRDELKKILYVKKKDRIHACVNPPEFQFVFSTFCNYEVRYCIPVLVYCSSCVKLKL